MAITDKKTQSNNLIDPIYQKFTRSVMRALGSTEFYEFFMDTISRADNQFQFSNRKMEKLIDLTWVDAIEEALPGFQNIVNNPRNIIREDEIIVNVANAKKAGPDVVRHLAQHGSMVENFNEETGEVRPSKLMQKIREDSTELYENRLVYTVLEHSFHFVQIRHSALFDAMGEEYGAKLKVESNLDSATEQIHVDMYLHIKEKDSILETDEKNRDVFERISRMYRLLGSFMNTQFAEQMRKVNRVKGNIMKTNVLKKNPDYKKIVKLWEFLHQYDDVGYLIKVTEQNPYVDERLTQDIFHNIMFQYIILKGYLEDEKDRELPKPARSRKRKLRPKFIREIIEEMTEDYDLPDVEIRKVLIEELTKEQLLLEEEAERNRLLEEQEQRRLEEEARKQAEEEARRKLEEEEEERIRQEQEELKKKELQARMERELEDRRRSGIFLKELQFFEKHRMDYLQARSEEDEKRKGYGPIESFEDAAFRIEEEERRKLEAEERARRKKEEMEERRRRMEEAEKERKRKEEEAAKEKKRLEAEEEIRRKKEEKAAAQLAKDMTVVGIYFEEAEYFQSLLKYRIEQRRENDEEFRMLMAQEEIDIEPDLEPKGIKWRFGIR